MSHPMKALFQLEFLIHFRLKVEKKVVIIQYRQTVAKCSALTHFFIPFHFVHIFWVCV